MDPNYFSFRSNHTPGDSFQNLSESDYAKVIFCDLYYNNDSTVGCRFQITDHVHEDPSDYIGLFRVGYDNLSQCLASKLLSETDCEEDGKMLRCTFKPSELPELENGFYQFLYVTRDNEVCGASMPFEVKNSMKKDLCSDEDIVADNAEDDFMLVRSNMAEKNRRLQGLLDEMTQKLLIHENQMRDVQQKLKIVNEEKLKLETLLKKAREEKETLTKEVLSIAEEKNSLCHEKEEAIRILKEKNKVLSSMFDNYTEKLKEFAELKNALEAEKCIALEDNVKLLERIEKLNKELQNEKTLLKNEKTVSDDLRVAMKKEASKLFNQLDDATLMIQVLEESKNRCKKDISLLNDKNAKLQEKMRDVKCENLALKTRMNEAMMSLKKVKAENETVMSELMALKLHVIELHESRQNSRVEGREVASAISSQILAEVKSSQPPEESVNMGEVKNAKEGQKGVDMEEVKNVREVQNAAANNNDLLAAPNADLEQEGHTTLLSTELRALKVLCDDLQAQLNEKNAVFENENNNLEILHKELTSLKTICEEKDATIGKLKEELVKANGVIEYLTKERESLQSHESAKQKALDECILRLNEASELYKKQFRKIEKLKKKLNKSSENFMERSSGMSQIDSADEASATAAQLPQNLNSDSDTGEHVGQPTQIGRMENTVVYKTESVVSQQSSVSSVASCSKDTPVTTEKREVPGLQTLIEMNLEKLKHSKSKDDTDGMFSIPCPVCDQDVGIHTSSSDEMIKHLEMQHKQQICPVCGRLFDMTLPAKYFIFHVEDHFKASKK